MRKTITNLFAIGAGTPAPRTARWRRRLTLVVAAVALASATTLAGTTAAQAADCGPYADLPALSGPPIIVHGLYTTRRDHREIRADGVTRCLINNEREKVGVPALRHNPWLSVGASYYTDDMVRNHLWDPKNHLGSDGSTVGTRNSAYQANCRGKQLYSMQVWETIHYSPDNSSPTAAVRNWMNSPSHAAVLLDPKIKEFGVDMRAVTPFGGPGGTYTADFGTCS